MIPQNQHQWVGALDLLSLLPTQTVAGSTVATGAGFDLKDHHGNALVLLDTSATTTGKVVAKVQTSPDADKVTRAGITYSGTGNGKLSISAGPDSVAENITITFSNATTAAVAGSVGGPYGTLTVGTAFSCPQCSAYVAAGSTAFINTDVFTVPTTARTWTDALTFADITTVAKQTTKTLPLDQNFRYVRGVATPSGTTPSSDLSVNLLACIANA